jgi:hypothetical protein
MTNRLSVSVRGYDGVKLMLRDGLRLEPPIDFTIYKELFGKASDIAGITEPGLTATYW